MSSGLIPIKELKDYYETSFLFPFTQTAVCLISAFKISKKIAKKRPFVISMKILV